MGERYVRNVQVGGSIPLCSTKEAVLDGELAVPCDLQSAIAGLNSHTEVISSPGLFLASGDDRPSPAQWATAEPRQDREVAAVSRSSMCRRYAWLELATRNGLGIWRIEGGCTAFFCNF
jgi:hypothetical protein